MTYHPSNPKPPTRQPAPKSLHLDALAAAGFWFCKACQHICEPEEPAADYLKRLCNLCSSPRLEWVPAVPK